MRDLTLENPIRAIREISHDVTCRGKVRLATGRELTAIDIQTRVLRAGGRGSSSGGGADERRRSGSSQKWGAALDALPRAISTAGPQGRLGGEAHLIERYRAKHDLPLAHPRVALMDLAYHEVNRDAGPVLPAGAARAGWSAWSPRSDVQRAMREPPQTTRARLRGEFIRQAKAKRRDYTVDWVHLKLNDQAQRTVLCKDPFKSVDERVEQLIAHM